MKRILVVDDSQSVRETLVLVLRYSGFDAAGAATAPAALESSSKQRPDILLCDIQLGGTNGIELTQQIVELLPECRVFIISGDTSSTEILADAPARGYRFELLPKPTVPTELLALLGRP